MKKWLIPVIILVVLGIGIYQWAVGFNNTAVKLKETSTQTWANFDSEYAIRYVLF